MTGSPDKYTGEKTVSVYTLSQSGSPKYQGNFDFRSFVMRTPNTIIIPYSPVDHPFPFLDVIIPEFNSFLLIGDKPTNENKNMTKEIHYLIWKQKTYYKFVPFLFNFPLKYTKSYLFKKMLIQPKDDNQYELWKIRDHNLFEKIEDHVTQRPAEIAQDDGKAAPDFDSLVVMKIIPFENLFVKIHVRFTFFHIGTVSKYIGSPLIIGIDRPETLNNLLHKFPNFAPKWVHNCEIRFIIKRKNETDQSQPFKYDDYLFDNDQPGKKIPYFQIICKLINKDDLLLVDLEDEDEGGDKNK